MMPRGNAIKNLANIGVKTQHIRIVERKYLQDFAIITVGRSDNTIIVVAGNE